MDKKITKNLDPMILMLDSRRVLFKSLGLLPRCCQEIGGMCKSSGDMDIVLGASLVAMSSCLDGIYGFYDSKKYHPNIMLVVTGVAGSGKARMLLSRELVGAVHRELVEKSRCALQAYYIAKRVDKGQLALLKPKRDFLLLSANISHAKFSKLMCQLDHSGLIIDSEVDTMAKKFKSSYGDYSDDMRKCAEHEEISYDRCGREGEDDGLSNAEPQLSVALSCTPDQLSGILGNGVDGMSSRYLYITVDPDVKWKNPKPTGTTGEEAELMRKLGVGLKEHRENLIDFGPIEFRMSDEKWDELSERLGVVHDELIEEGLHGEATYLRRLGCMLFRLMMSLDGIRLMEKKREDWKRVEYITDDTFSAVMLMAEPLFAMAKGVYDYLRCGMTAAAGVGDVDLSGLGDRFSTSEFLRVTGFTNSTGKRRLNELVLMGVIVKVRRGEYMKVKNEK